MIECTGSHDDRIARSRGCAMGDGDRLIANLVQGGAEGADAVRQADAAGKSARRIGVGRAEGDAAAKGSYRVAIDILGRDGEREGVPGDGRGRCPRDREVVEGVGSHDHARARAGDGIGAGGDRLRPHLRQRRAEAARAARQAAARGQLRLGIGVGAAEADLSRKARDGVAVCVLGRDAECERSAGHRGSWGASDGEVIQRIRCDDNVGAGPAAGVGGGGDRLRACLRQRRAEAADAVGQPAAGG